MCFVLHHLYYCIPTALVVSALNDFLLADIKAENQAAISCWHQSVSRTISTLSSPASGRMGAIFVLQLTETTVHAALPSVFLCSLLFLFLFHL